MTLNLKLAIATISAMTVLSGCAESQTFGQGVNTVLNSTVKDIQTALMGTNNAANATNTTNTTVQPTSNSTDWTPYLRSMQAGCNTPDLEQIPSQYRSSISSIQSPSNANREGEDKITTYNLNNATAFGYPLQKIEKLRGYEWGHVRLYFKDSRFTALRSQFKPPQNGSYNKLERSDASGYQFGSEMGAVVMTFDVQNRSITCDY